MEIAWFAMAATWQRGADYGLRVIGYRSQTVGVPYSALSIARSWTVPYLYGDRLTLGVDVGQVSAPAKRDHSSRWSVRCFLPAAVTE